MPKSHEVGHVPGPWAVVEDVDGLYDCLPVIKADSGDGTAIAVLLDETGEDWTVKEITANARLIAAAPELLEELKAVLYGYTVHTDNAGLHNDEAVLELIAYAQAAIAKAEGRA